MTHLIKTSFLLTAALGALALSACTTTEAKAKPMAASATEPAAPEMKSGAATLTINVSGFEVQEGNVMAALSDEAGYGGKPLRGATEPVTGETVKLIFKELPVGTYAIRMFHDVNGDGEMNTNVFGIPTEPYAFSNNAAGTMGPAPWSKAKFEVTGDGAVQNITF
ncbi:DUF2141 domain-containing protein [Litorimonas haliclonae]|uniref:DUF2141 domain-containing protein n=1 Tax=Litorimonas haliclonae TaxID=2081977 RepID=UPI0039EEF372